METRKYPACLLNEIGVKLTMLSEYSVGNPNGQTSSHVTRKFWNAEEEEEFTPGVTLSLHRSDQECVHAGLMTHQSCSTPYQSQKQAVTIQIMIPGTKHTVLHSDNFVFVSSLLRTQQISNQIKTKRMYIKKQSSNHNQTCYFKNLM
ncbi:hypothetical protein V1264_021370 [Littorina saxatilis]|uniref:Uncharacterized protein n=1 Tax=Littorina saxatilis TaxID=31220 RepID=A0AAN9AI04_9CAEN